MEIPWKSHGNPMFPCFHDPIPPRHCRPWACAAAPRLCATAPRGRTGPAPQWGPRWRRSRPAMVMPWWCHGWLCCPMTWVYKVHHLIVSSHEKDQKLIPNGWVMWKMGTLNDPWWRDLVWLNQLNQTKYVRRIFVASMILIEDKLFWCGACRPISGKFTSKSQEHTFHQHQQAWVPVLEKVYGKENESLCSF